MENRNNIEPVEVFSGTTWEASMVKSLLANAEIEAFLIDENVGTLAPWYTGSGGVGAVKVVVSSADYVKAKLVVAGYENNQRSERQDLSE